MTKSVSEVLENRRSNRKKLEYECHWCGYRFEKGIAIWQNQDIVCSECDPDHFEELDRCERQKKIF